MSKPERTVSLWDIRIPKETKEKLRKLAIKEKVEPDFILTAVINKLYKAFYEENRQLFKKGEMQ